MKSQKLDGSGWRTSAVALSLLAALFSALTLVNDTNVLHNVIVSKNSMASVLVYLVLGSWVGVLANFIYNRFLGKFVEPCFNGEKWLSVRVQLFAFGAGALAAVSTFAYLLVANDGDPSILIALSNFALIYLAFYDHIRAKVSLIRQSAVAVLVLVGAFLVSVQSSNTSFFVTGKAIVLMLGVSCTCGALSRVLEKEIVGVCGGVNLTFWRFLWLAVCATVLAFGIAGYLGILSDFTALFSSVWLRSLPWVALTMLLAYGENTLRILAQKHGNVSTVAVVMSSKIIMAVPLTVLIAVLAPSWAFTVPTDPIVWVLRAVGCGLVLLGVLVCQKK